ncbi:unnamed protein product [Kuraishia capsulata CBS 1993]|uniref:Zn(2)-C6 fungal-type domain-containing protein n=1 Tax=Kuraishia capsulata CBS 1993 TaxID=1382522 RepID=W6MTB7_9ASCO|nr:uncharacterized protein KUCA_T00005974001 [Kuraishia capsulata CBS 1993]CDK29979.1 unnamed protein product [Kuraishia capsulata CBS 1993]
MFAAGSPISPHLSTKRAYSKSGCKECKRRKVKCDEGKPFCWNCQRLKRDCEYPAVKSQKKAKPDATVTYELNTLAGVGYGLVPPILGPLPISYDDPALAGNVSDLNKPNVLDEDEMINANSLKANLNDLVNLRLVEVGGVSYNENGEATVVDQSLWQHNLIKTKYEFPLTPPTSVPDVALQKVELESYPVEEEHKRYLTFFYKEFAPILLPFTPMEDLNPVRDILLTYGQGCPYLLSAILACGAFSAYRATPTVEDEQSYRQYLSNCLRLLSSGLADERRLAENVDALLLTILLLTSYNATSTSQTWRPHLKGARDLLSVYGTESESAKDSLVISFCRAWYIAIETLAGLGASLGGTLHTQEEIGALLVPSDVPKFKNDLEALWLLRSDGFNLLYGYTENLSRCLQSLIGLLRRVKAKKWKRGENWCTERGSKVKYFEVLPLLSELYGESNFQIISNTGIVPVDHFMHPENDRAPPADFQPLPHNAIGTVINADGSVDYISWFDISQQAYATASVLTILTQLLRMPSHCPAVQSVLKRVLGLMHFLRSVERESSTSLSMLHWPMYIVGLNCVEKEDRESTQLFFNLLADTGAEAADKILNRIKHNWTKVDQVKYDYGLIEKEQNDSEDEEDILLY